MTRRPVDLSVMPADLAVVYATKGGIALAAKTDHPFSNHPRKKLAEGQLALAVEPAEAEFRHWLEAQPAPTWMDAA